MKKAAYDFEENMLPRTRRQQFSDILKQRWCTFLLLGGFSLISAVAAILISWRGELANALTLKQLETEAITSLQAMSAIASTDLYTALFLVPALTIVAIMVAGILRIIKQLVWSEGIDIRYDFKRGVKENWLHCLIIVVVLALLNTGITFAENSYALNKTIDFGTAVSVMPQAIYIILCLPVNAFFVNMTAVYNEKFFRKLKLSFICYFKTFPATLLMLVLSLMPFFLLFIANSALYLIVLLLYAFAFPVVMLAWFLFTISIFDKYINSQHFPELVGRGLYK